MAARRMAIILLLLCLCLAPCRAMAASTDEALEPIATTKECSLTMGYRCEDTAFADVSVKLYKVAEVSEDFQYTLTAPFAPSGLILNGIQSNGEWNTIRTTLEAYILAKGLDADTTAVTDAQGNAVFTGLETGLYLVAEVTVSNCRFASALVALPGLGAEGLWQYDVTVAAKPEIFTQPDNTVQMKVLKLWKGDEGRNDRPKSIEVKIFRNGELYETVILSQDNNWAYTWTAKDDNASWKVAETNVPEGYTVSVDTKETAFVLTNTRNTPGTPPPLTGDTANILLYAVLMFVSGGMLIILGIIGKRKSK